jgi:hypothetical protein
MSDIKYIGVTGLARSGKNLYCDILSNQLKTKHGLSSKTYALAYELKKDCEDFVNNKLGLDVFTEVTDQKSIFREMLVWFAAIKRKQTKGRYWLELLNKRLLRDINPPDVIIISDIRFAEFPTDEVFWLKNELKGKLIHVSKYTHPLLDKTRRIYMEPPNAAEAKNDPMVKELADYKLEWEDVGGDDLLNNQYLNSVVEKTLEIIL